MKWKQLLEMENTLAACFLSPGLATTDISVYSWIIFILKNKYVGL
jgi:hypothetical protein